MAERKDFNAGGKLLSSLLSEAIGNGSGALPSAYDLSAYRQAFSDADLVDTCLHLFDNDLNVSRTAKRLYMHRNTLIYRVNKLKRLTGLDVCTFNGAVDFIILYRTYLKEIKK